MRQVEEIIVTIWHAIVLLKIKTALYRDKVKLCGLLKVPEIVEILWL